jgi:hypothetical protein
MILRFRSLAGTRFGRITKMTPKVALALVQPRFWLPPWAPTEGFGIPGLGILKRKKETRRLVVFLCSKKAIKCVSCDRLAAVTTCVRSSTDTRSRNQGSGSALTTALSIIAVRINEIVQGKLRYYR